MTIRQIIISRANELGIKAHRLAELSGVSKAHVHRYFAGDRDVTSEVLDKMLAALSLVVKPKK